MEKSISEINRRQAMVMAGAGALAFASGATPAAASDDNLRGALQALAGKIFYSTDRPGRWKGKEKGHSPLIKVDKDGSNVLVRAATQHPMDADHYIIKHILMDQQLNLIDEQVFDKVFDMPRSRFELQGYSGRIYVVSMCNLHDNWVNWSMV
jgi:superoxide reductase